MGGPGIADGVVYNCFNNFHPCVFIVKGKKYTSSEQYYQAHKFREEEWRDRIRAETSPNLVWQLGQSRKHTLIPDFENQKYQIMYAANYHKFFNNPELMDALLSTQNEEIIFHKSISYWNKANGQILMTLRSEFRKMKELDLR